MPSTKVQAWYGNCSIPFFQEIKPEISPLITLATKKKDAEAPLSSLMVLLTGLLSRRDLDLERLAEQARSSGEASQDPPASPIVTTRKQPQTRLTPAQQRELVLN